MGHDGIMLIAVAGVVGIGSVLWQQGRSRAILECWAAESGYRILAAKYCWFFRGPFSFTTGKGQSVYRVTVQDAHGYARSGYVKCGGFFLGVLSDVAKVKWDDEV
jgi:hypothetical protein